MATQIKKTVFGPLTANEKTEDGSAVEPGVAFSFPDGSEQVVLLKDLPTDVVTRLAVHGMSQKGGDSYSGAASQENPLGYAKQALAEVLKQLVDGDWRVTVAGGPRATLLARALARVQGVELDAAIDVVENLDDDTKKALHKDPRVKAAKADIKLEDAQAAKARAGSGKADEGDQADLGALFS